MTKGKYLSDYIKYIGMTYRQKISNENNYELQSNICT